MKKKLLIIDAYGFVFRAYHVHPPLTGPNGMQVGAIYGFTSMLLKVLNDFKDIPYAVVVFDSGGKNFRHQIYPEYKANRPAIPSELLQQLDAVRTVATSLNFPIIEKKNVEADDVIATLAAKAKIEDADVIIISSDKDLMQLIDSSTQMYDPMKGKYITKDDVIKKFGIPPTKVRDMLSLIGDNSDNIPGVVGVGAKTALDLLNKFDNLEQILRKKEEIANPRVKQLIYNGEEAAKVSWQLTGLDDKLDINFNLDSFKLGPPDAKKISEFLHNYNFKSLVKRIENLFALELMAFKADEIPVSNNSINVISIENQQQFDLFYKEVVDVGVVAVYLLSVNVTAPVLFISAYKKCYSFVCPTVNNDDLFSYNNRESNKFIFQIMNLFSDFSIKKITFNLKALLKYFEKLKPGIELVGFDDIELMEYSISAGLVQKNIFDLNFKQLTEEQIIEATAETLVLMQDKYNSLIVKLLEEKAFSLYKDIDLPLCYVLHRMETIGIKIDLKTLNKLSQEFGHDIKGLEEVIYLMAGEEFNIASVKQLGEVLFNKLHLPFGKNSPKTTSFSTSVEVLEKLSREGYQIADLLLKWRGLTKLKSTYADALPLHIDNYTQRIHTTFLQNSTSTSRLSSQDPNLQNIPIRTIEGHKIRAVFIPKENHKFVSADYSQIELRILAHVANIPSLKEAFLNKKDIHTDTAIRIFDVDEGLLTPDHRRKAKAINFGIIYGISAFGLAKQLNISNDQASEYINKYFIKYPGIKEYMDKTKLFAEEHGYVKNILGRKCYVPLIHDKKHSLKQFAQRAAINAPLQGTNADIIKIAMINIDKKLKEKKLNTKLILQIHDELLFEVPYNEVEIILPLIKNIMENAYILTVPLLVDIKLGDNWMDLQEYHI